MDGGLGACLGDVSLHWAPRKLLGAADQDVQPTHCSADPLEVWPRDSGDGEEKAP